MGQCGVHLSSRTAEVDPWGSVATHSCLFGIFQANTRPCVKESTGVYEDDISGFLWPPHEHTHSFHPYIKKIPGLSPKMRLLRNHCQEAVGNRTLFCPLWALHPHSALIYI